MRVCVLLAERCYSAPAVPVHTYMNVCVCVCVCVRCVCVCVCVRVCVCAVCGCVFVVLLAFVLFLSSYDHCKLPWTVWDNVSSKTNLLLEATIFRDLKTKLVKH